jgi:dUTP pyrophosphatase
MNKMSIKLVVNVMKSTSYPQLPTYGTEQSAGADVYSAEYRVVKAKSRELIPTGLKICISDGFEIQVRPRSGLALKNGITVLNAPGTIDSDYRGEIMVCMVNFGKTTFMIEHKMRIAQIILRQNISINWEIANSLLNTDRGSGGFGSTGL